MLIKEGDDCDHKERCDGWVMEQQAKHEADQVLEWLLVNENHLEEAPQAEHEVEDKLRAEVDRLDDVLGRENEEEAGGPSECVDRRTTLDEEVAERATSEQGKDDRWLDETERMESVEDDLVPEAQQTDRQQTILQMSEDEIMWSDSSTCEEGRAEWAGLDGVEGRLEGSK